MTNSGMTLTSMLVALALTSVTAVFGTRLVIDQLSLANSVIIMSKGESIFRFYSALVLDSDAWQATLNGDTDLKDYVKRHDVSPPAPNNKISLTLRDAIGNVMIPSSGMKLKDEIVYNSTPDGWWEVELSWVKMGRGSVDLILELCLNKATFQSAPENLGRQNIANAFGFLCPNKKRTTRIRYSENSVQLPTTTCGAQGKAVRAISTHSAPNSRFVTCSTYELVNSNQRCAGRKLVFAISSGVGSCTVNRTGVYDTGSPCQNGAHIQVESTGIACSSNSFLVNLSGTRCYGDEVVCGFNSDMTVQCCKTKGPDGAQGERGAPSNDKGPDGDQGDQGPKGDPGNDAETSTIKGPKGERGPRGIAGVGTQCR